MKKLSYILIIALGWLIGNELFPESPIPFAVETIFFVGGCINGFILGRVWDD